MFQSKDLIYKAHYEGWYSVSDETYYTESQIREYTDATGKSDKVGKLAEGKTSLLTEQVYRLLSSLGSRSNGNRKRITCFG